MTAPQIGHRHVHWESTDSTNNRAAEDADDPQQHGTIYTAAVQAQGRGQHGRRWESAPGANLLLSVLLFPPKPLCRPPLMTALAALAVGDTVATLTSQLAQIKWPNDVLIQRRKVCGILIESGLKAGHSSPYFVVGIGVNVNTTQSEFDQQGLPHATSLALHRGQPLPIADVRQALVQHLNERYAELQGQTLAVFEQCWADRLGLLNRWVTVERMDAHEEQGTLIELTFERLTLLQESRTLSFRPEEVRHLR